jgi:hypothetical protein
MTPTALGQYLSQLIHHDLKLALMLWGPPGIGKSAIVAQTAAQHGLDFIDLRLSQLAPTDLRGLPVPQDGLSKWFPPEFLPQDGQGILFLDEINMAPPTMQGMAQQLILDRKVGSYHLPPGWYIWAAGNRKEDRAAVFDMPAPLANRFIHLSVEPDLESFKHFAFHRGLSEHILAFLAFRPTLLHEVSTTSQAWPSPRSWEMAHRLYQAGLSIAPAVGDGAASEFMAFVEVYQDLPALSQILAGLGNLAGQELLLPEEPSARYAITTGLAVHTNTIAEATNALHWLLARAPMEWTQLLLVNLTTRLQSLELFGQFITANSDDMLLQDFLAQAQALVGLREPRHNPSAKNQEGHEPVGA